MKSILLSLLILMGCTTLGISQNVSQIIQNKIESGVEAKKITADGIILFSQTVLPEFYEDNEYKPVWLTKGKNANLVAALESSYLEGLTPDDYHLERIKLLIDKTKNNSADEQLADLDLLMTDAILLYASHLIAGKVNQSKIRKGAHMPTNAFPVNEAELLETAINSQNIEEFINSFKPDNFMYVHLKNGLANYREIAENGGWQKVTTDKVLKPEMEDESVVSLREYLKVTGDLPQNTISENDSLFDEDVENAVKKFQFRHNLTQDGVVGKGTLAAINVPVEQRIDEIRVNLERARWVMHHLEDDFLVVNIAGYNLRRVTNDSVVFYSKVIVGRHYHESPIFKGKMKYIILNPTWTLPYSIATKESLVKLKKDPKYLEKHNMVIMNRSGKEIDPSTIDFNKLSRGNFPYIIRQNAGPHNALGQVKFIFPNKYSVYVHDTPARGLFAKEKRAFSHGCIRLDNKWGLFLNLMGDSWNMDKINEVLDSGETTRVNLENPIDILLLYWTAGADKQNNLYFDEDIYERDPAVLTELNKPLE